MAKVIRIEHRTHKVNREQYEGEGANYYKGCYHYHGEVKAFPQWLYDDMRRLPVPCTSWWNWDTRYIFAFSNIRALMEWFTPNMHRALSELGFVIAIYEVPLQSVKWDDQGIQCVFNPAHAKKVQRVHYKDESTLYKLAA